MTFLHVPWTALAGIFIGQLAHALLRTSAVRAIGLGSEGLTVALNLAANLVRLLVLAGGIDAVTRGSWIGVTAFLAGQGIGDYLSMKIGSRISA